MRRMADQEKKLLLAYRDELHVAYRHGRCAARSGVDQRHLAEDIVVGKRFEHAIAQANLDLPALDDEQLLGIVPFPENDVASLKFAYRTPAPANIRKSIGSSAISVPLIAAVMSSLNDSAGSIDRQCAKIHAF
jgi:hypothetical protein